MATGLSSGFVEEILRQAAKKQLTQNVAERMDNLAYDAMAGTTTTVAEPEPTIKEQDFDCLRDFLVDMCSATLPEHPPSQEDWDEIRKRAKAAAVEHAMYNREEKKAVKKPGGQKKFFTPLRSGKSSLFVNLYQSGNVTIPPMLSNTPLQGARPDLLIVDDIGA